MPFKSAPILEVRGNGGWRLVRPLTYDAGDGRAFTVPAGFITDLASIPRLFHSLIPVNGRHRAAAILHDWLFVEQPMTRAETDALFLRAMEEEGVRWSQRRVMWSAVRLGGWPAWRRNAAALAADRAGFLARHGITARAHADVCAAAEHA